MRRPRPRPLHVIAVLGLLALLSPLTSGLAAAAPPPDAGAPPPGIPESELTAVTLTISGTQGAALVGTVSCEPEETDGEERVTVVADVSQQLELPPVTGQGSAEVVCGPQPVPFTLPLRGWGILVDGKVSYSAYVFTHNRNGPADEVKGELTHTGGAAAMTQNPPDGGPLEISVQPLAGISDNGHPVAHGTVACNERGYLSVKVEGWQQAGQHHLGLRGKHELYCLRDTGVITFNIPFDSWDGELVPGPATVRIKAWSHLESPSFGEGDDPSYKTTTMTLQSHTPEPEFDADPVQNSPVTIGAVTRISEGLLVAETSLEACEPGTTFRITTSISPTSARHRDRWWDPRLFSSSSSRTMRCTGEPIVAFLGVGEMLESDEVLVSVYRSPLEPPSDAEGFWSNQAEVTVSTK